MKLLTPVLGRLPSAAQSPDPWCRYFEPQANDVESWIEALRKLAAKEGR